MAKIIQNTPEWLQAKKSKIGGSEIYSLVYHYCKPELEALGIDLIKDKPFKSVLELFIKIKHGEEINDIEEVHKVFGNVLEEYIAYRLRKELPESKIDRTKKFVLSPTFHILAACSPDGYIELPEFSEIEHVEPFFLIDFDKTCKINHEWGIGMVELKTANFFSKFQQGGSRLQYIFQDQYNMRCEGLKWGILTALTPKEEQIEIEGVSFPSDDPFVKGWNGNCAREGNYEFLDQFYDLQYYVYPTLPAFQTIIEKALNAFQTDLDNNKYPNPSFGDKARLEREKKLLGKLWPDKFGEIQADEEINDYINQRMTAHNEALKAETEKVEFDNKIILATKKYTKIIGTDYKATYDSRGSLRYSRV